MTRLLASLLVLLAIIITGYTVDSKHEDDRISASSKKDCIYDEFVCGNGDCISKTNLCNGKKDCTDGVDELGCSPFGCGLREFRCANKQCVGISTRCDGIRNCVDGSDEEGCTPSSPGSPCKYHEFECASGDRCIPRNNHCDMRSDCRDESDELGCFKVYIHTPPPAEVELNVGETFTITCIAVGVPVPEINWQLDSGDIPAKCKTTSVNGVGTLTCPDIATEDLGTYSCVAMNKVFNYYSFKWNLALRHTILVRKGTPIDCPAGQFNPLARSPEECISCFCSGISDGCSSAGLFINELRRPFDQFKTVAVDGLTILGPSNRRQYFFPVGKNGVLVTDYSYNDGKSSITPFFALPESYLGNRLKSYGGYLTYRVLHIGQGKVPNGGFSVILSGNNYVLGHEDEGIEWETETEQRVRFVVGKWKRMTEDKKMVLASREEIMMTLANIDNILLKIKYGDGIILTTITNFAMDSAEEHNIDLGHAWFVEKCNCPNGYTGLSCENCASGFTRRSSGPWLGQCYKKEPANCQPGTYGDLSRNISCQVCPCPLTLPSNQFAKTCKLGSGGQPICDCAQGYVGARCERCAPGYQGNPFIANDKCVKVDERCKCNGHATQCHPETGVCEHCRDHTTGHNCSVCEVGYKGDPTRGTPQDCQPVREAPTMVLYRLRVLVGGSALLTCPTESEIPKPELTWAREDRKPFSSNIEQLSDGVIKISNVSLDDGGSFVCSASNKVGSTSTKIVLEVYSRPFLTITPSNRSPLVVKIGDRVLLTCKATGQPHPSVKWCKSSNGLALSKVLTSDVVYEISSVSLEDAGSYTCIATNSEGTVKEHVKLIVKDDSTTTKPPMPDGHGITLPALKLRIPVDAVRAKIRCQIVDPDGKFRLDWKRSDGRSLPEGSSVRDGTLFIPRTTCEMAGEYVCQKMNITGYVQNQQKTKLEITGCTTGFTWWGLLG